MTAEVRIPIEEAARRLGTTVVAVLMHIKGGRLEGEEIDGGWYVGDESLERLHGGKGSAGARSCRSSCGGCSGGG